MYVLLETFPKCPTAILTASRTVTFVRTATACMNISVEGEQQLEVASDFLYPLKWLSFITLIKMEESQTDDLFPTANTEVLPVIVFRYLPGLWTVLYWYEVLLWNLWVNHQCSMNDKRVHQHTKNFPNHCKESISFHRPARKWKHSREYNLKTLFKCVTMSEGICDSYWATNKWFMVR